MNSNYSKTPHVCFKAEFSSATRADSELPRLVERQLHTRFDSVRVIRTWFLARAGCVVQIGEKSFTVALTRSKFGDDEWILLVGPLDTPRLLDRLLRRESLFDASKLMLICREIHTLLTAIPNITAVRWYFEGFRSQTAAVATPDELPWTGT